MKKKFTVNKLTLLLISLFLISTIASNAQEFKRIGYLPTYRFDFIEEINLEKLTHLNIAFAGPDANGQLSADGFNIRDIVEKGHEADLEVFIALSGAGYLISVWNKWIAPNNRSFFIHNIMQYALFYDLQGIDVDLEWSNVNEDYSGFVLELRDSTSAHGLQLSAALPGTYRYPEVSDAALDAFDWVNMMAYDQTGPWDPQSPGPHSPYSLAVKSVDHWLSKHKVSGDKLTLGVPFYGYDFTNQNSVKSMTFAQIVQLDTENAGKDQVGKIYYNGLPTIERKTKLALNNLSGIMIWELGQDSFDEYSLLDKIDETIEGHFQTSTVEINPNDLAVAYPNPFDYNVQVKFNQPQTAIVSLISIDGKVIENQQIYNQNIVSFSTNELPHGMYLIKVEGEAFTVSYKLVK